jgi:hypothetical protein
MPCYGAWRCADPVAKLKPQIPYFVVILRNGSWGAIMMRRAITLVLSCAALSGCGALPSMPSFSLPNFNMPSFSGGGASGTPVHVTSVPAGAEASFGKDSCTTPCTLAAPSGAGTYNVSFKLNGYYPQSVPVRIAVNESSSMQSGDSGIAPTTVITPDPVMVELAAMKPPAARTKTKPTTTTAASSRPLSTTRTAAKSVTPPALSPPPPATTTAETSVPPPASLPPPPAITTANTSAPPSSDPLARKAKLGVWDSISRWWNER